MGTTKIRFLGGAGTVTGSKHLIETPEGRRLLVDCGLFQGLKKLRELNWSSFPIPPHSIEAVILTHAHLDHCGYLPLLRKQGFSGPIYGTSPTRALARLILLDSAHLQEEDTEYANKKGFSKHHPALPLYNSDDVERALTQFRVQPVREWFMPCPGVRARMTPNGHILGSVCVEVETSDTTIGFTGDLGRENPVSLQPPERLASVRNLVTESTYGDRCHPAEPPEEAIRQAILEVCETRGHLIIPSFSVGRAQDLLLLIHRLRAASRIPFVPVFLDSPMAIDATSIFSGYSDWHRLDGGDLQGINSVATHVRTRNQSRELLTHAGPCIIIAGSGMVTGGRVLHHLFHRLPESKNRVLLAGFQAAGTRGASLLAGAPDIKIHGAFVPVRAAVRVVENLSAHADQRELERWISTIASPKAKRVFIVHGEPQASEALKLKLAPSYDCTIPEALSEHDAALRM